MQHAPGRPASVAISVAWSDVLAAARPWHPDAESVVVVVPHPADEAVTTLLAEPPVLTPSELAVAGWSREHYLVIEP